MMTIFSELKNNIPLVDFSIVLSKALVIYCYIPKTFFLEFRAIDDAIMRGDLDENTIEDSVAFLFELESNEIQIFQKTEQQHFVVVDVVLWKAGS